MVAILLFTIFNFACFEVDTGILSLDGSATGAGLAQNYQNTRMQNKTENLNIVTVNVMDGDKMVCNYPTLKDTKNKCKPMKQTSWMANNENLDVGKSDECAHSYDLPICEVLVLHVANFERVTKPIVPSIITQVHLSTVLLV